MRTKLPFPEFEGGINSMLLTQREHGCAVRMLWLNVPKALYIYETAVSMRLQHTSAFPLQIVVSRNPYQIRGRLRCHAHVIQQ